MRLYDLTSPEQRQIATKTFAVPPAESRRLAHRIADEVVLQFTGEAGIADTKIAFITAAARRASELQLMDYDGVGVAALTANQSINLSPAWSPDTRSLAFTSFMRGYPYLYRMFPFERRPVQLLAGYLGINSSPAWSPDGRSVALTLSKDGNPEVYVLNVAAGAFRRVTTHPGIDTEPSWSPDGPRDRLRVGSRGAAQVYVMDAEGTNVRRITQGGFNTQPRWSPKGDAIVYTSRQGNHDLWAVGPDGSGARRLTAGPGDNESASWSPNGRHLVFQSTRGAASGSSRCSPTAPSSTRCRAARETRQVPLGPRGFRDRLSAKSSRGHRRSRVGTLFRWPGRAPTVVHKEDVRLCGTDAVARSW